MQYWSTYWGGSFWGGTTAYWADLNAVVTMINRIFRYTSTMIKSMSMSSVMAKSISNDSKMTKRISVTTEMSDVG